MSKKPSRATTATTAGNVPAPVRVRLRRINCDYARASPPDGQAREWWQRLKNAFGSSSSAFVDASLVQLIAAARLPGSGISETLLYPGNRHPSAVSFSIELGRLAVA
jgi:hypothetical protein